jgi:hypothetical protein
MCRNRCVPDANVAPTHDELKRISEITTEGLMRRARARDITLEQYVAWVVAEKRGTSKRHEDVADPPSGNRHSAPNRG